MTAVDKEKRIALLIDADNAPASKIDDILTELSTLGVINVRRAYGNWTKPELESWKAKLLEYAIRPVQQFDYSKRKNATDMAMTVDAMDLFYADRPDSFGIVSSDADFTPLVMHLRAKGAAVYGFGASQTPKAFVNACSRFLYLEALGQASLPIQTVDLNRSTADVSSTLIVVQSSPAEAVVTPAATRSVTLRLTTAQLRQDTRLLHLLRDAVQASTGEDGWATVGAVGTQIANKTSFDARNYGYPTLSKLLSATEAFELRGEGTPRVSVHDRRENIKAFRSESVSPEMNWRILSVSEGRKPRVVIRHPGMYALRAALVTLAIRKVCVADILIAVPELTERQPYAILGVNSRLRQKQLLGSSGSSKKLFELHPSSFRLLPSVEQPQAVLYVG